MAHDIRIWEIDEPSKTAEPLQPAARVETEMFLEDLLAENPDMLMPDLLLAGRQTPTDGGIIDLLGVDKDGQLVVFELKRGKLTRDAVAQVIDYCSYLESLTEDELADYVADHFDKNRNEENGDFKSLYVDRWGDKSASLRPVRMALVGLGAEVAARRMVDFLAAGGLDISLLTFHGWRHGTNTFLARQIESVEVRDTGRRSRQSQAEGRRLLDKQAERLGIAALWQNAVDALNVTSRSYPKARWITFGKPRIRLLDGTSHSHGASHSVGMTDDGKVRVTFYPVAVDLCLEQFQEAMDIVGFRQERPPNAFPTERVPNQWYCALDNDQWKEHKDRIVGLADAVQVAWEAARIGEAAV